MTVRVYTPHYNAEHARVLRALAEGIPSAVIADARDYQLSDIAVIYGLCKSAVPATAPKGEIIRRHKGPLLVVDSGYVHRDRYWAVGWNGLNGRAEFGNGGMPGDRWIKLNVDMAPWRAGGRYALVIGQVPWDATVQHTDHPAWCRETVAALLAAGHEVRFRPHPKAPNAKYSVPAQYVSTRHLADDLAGAERVVTYSSNAGVEAVIAGVPTVAADIGSMAWAVTGRDPVGPVPTPDREQWAASLAYTQWTLAEMASGEAWAHIRRAIPS